MAKKSRLGAGLGSTQGLDAIFGDNLTDLIEDIQNDIFKLNYNKIEISIDETNSASLKLFENAGFTRTSKDDELINLVYQKIN